MIELLMTTVLPALLPAAVDGVRGIFNRVTGGAGAQPANVKEVIELGRLEIDKLNALVALDTPTANISQWVADLRGAARYIGVGIIMVVWLAVVVLVAFGYNVPDGMQDSTANMAQAAFFFLYGDRMYSYIRRGSK